MIIDSTRAHDRTTTLILGYYAAFNRGDWAAMLALLTDDVAHDLNQGARETGHDAFAAFLARMDRSYREQLRDIVVMASPDGARAAAEYVVHGEYLIADASTSSGQATGLPPANGQKYRLPGGAFFDIVFQDSGSSKIARVTNYYNLQDWITQVS